MNKDQNDADTRRRCYNQGIVDSIEALPDDAQRGAWVKSMHDIGEPWECRAGELGYK